MVWSPSLISTACMKLSHQLSDQAFNQKEVWHPLPSPRRPRNPEFRAAYILICKQVKSVDKHSQTTLQLHQKPEAMQGYRTRPAGQWRCLLHGRRYDLLNAHFGSVFSPRLTGRRFTHFTPAGGWYLLLRACKHQTPESKEITRYGRHPPLRC